MTIRAVIDALIVPLALGLIVSSSIAHAACVDVNHTNTLTFEGTLTFHIFGGPPYNGGVRLGDTPEPTYILQLDDPICAMGDEFVDPKKYTHVSFCGDGVRKIGPTQFEFRAKNFIPSANFYVLILQPH
jgi:hypothetical protein